jgi:hypothetical protein
MVLFNFTAKGLRSGSMGSFIDKVLETSKVIEESTLMRQQMRGDEAAYKQDMMEFYYGQEMQYRKPSQVNSFKASSKKKSCKPKDFAIEITTKMYRLHCINIRELKEEIGNRVD